MFKYKIDKVLNRILTWEKYTIFRYEYGVMSEWTKKCGSHYAPYILHKGKGKDAKRYIVFRNSVDTGSAYLSYVKKCIFMADWAEKNGYIPLFDIEYDKVFKDGKLAVDNQFEYCFTNVVEINQLTDDDHVFVYAVNESIADERMCIEINGDRYIEGIKLVNDSSWKEYYHKIKPYCDKYLHFTDSFVEYINNKVADIEVSDKCMGVFIRDPFHMEYQKMIKNERLISLYKKHPQCGYITDMIPDIKSVFDKQNCNCLFLSTKCTDTIELFEKLFEDKPVYIHRERRKWQDMADRANGDKTRVIQYDGRENIMSYVTEIVLLSRCKCLIGTPAGGMTMALALNGGQYEDCILFKDYNNSSIY